MATFSTPALRHRPSLRSFIRRDLGASGCMAAQTGCSRGTSCCLLIEKQSSRRLRGQCRDSSMSAKHKLQSLTLCKKPRRLRSAQTRVFPFDLAWDVDSQTLASNLFASSIIPYAGFLYYLQKSKRAPKLMMFGFYFLLVFVLATIVAGIYAKVQYKTILANVDYLHGSAESFLTLTNLLIVLGLRQGIKEAQEQDRQQQQRDTKAPDLQEKESVSK